VVDDHAGLTHGTLYLKRIPFDYAILCYTMQRRLNYYKEKD
jgi:hypothetical protein